MTPKFVLISSLFVSLLSSCGKIENPEFRRLEGFEIKSLGITESRIGFATVYYNPNGFGLTVKEAAIDVYADSMYLGKFLQSGSTDVAKKAEFTIPFEGSVSLAEAFKMNLPSLVGKQVQIRAEGKVRVGKGGVFVTRKIEYSGSHVLDAALIKNPAGAGSKN
jgi:LEA14-like dessication related protein